MNTDIVIQKLQKAPNLMAVSKATGIPYTSLWRVARGQEAKASVVDKLREHFQRQQ